MPQSLAGYKSLFYLLQLLVLLAGCSPLSQQPVEDVDTATESGKTLQVPAQSGGLPHNAAVDSLLAQANEAIRTGDYQRAAARIERAIRLAPEDARAYFGLAQVHYYQHRPELGRSFLAKAEAFAANDRAMLKAIQQFRNQYEAVN